MHLAPTLALLFLTIGQVPADAIPGIGPTGPIEKFQTGFVFTEGPVDDGAGNFFFSDILTNKVYKVADAGKASPLLERSSLCNGLAFDKMGRLIACQGRTGKIIAIDPTDGSVTPICEGYNGKRFNQPNDLVIDSENGIYFTDPEFLTKALPQKTMGVYYLNAAGNVLRVVESLDLPNGIALSPDEKTLYVVQMGQSNVMAYPILGLGKLGPGEVFAKLEHPGDGMAIDSAGNLYVTQPEASGIAVIDPAGKSLGLIKFPEAPANCAFGGKDRKTLFATARRSVYAGPMEISGQK
jgi:gluconolactonase